MNPTAPSRRALRPGVVGVLLAVVLAAFLPWLLRVGRHSAAPSFGDADPVPHATGDACADSAVPVPTPALAVEAARVQTSPLEEQGGIQVGRVELAMAGAALNIRYTIVASNKASELHDQAVPAYLVDQSGQTRISLGSAAAVGSLSGHSRARSAMASMTDARGFPPAPNRLREGEAYSLLIPNPRGAIKAGDKVSLVVGAFYVENLTVESPQTP